LRWRADARTQMTQQQQNAFAVHLRSRAARQRNLRNQRLLFGSAEGSLPG